ncbi:hypothetical protein FRC0493_02255 [Corynebacterium diphtheriae]|nr:hypothetical protein CIP107566_02301 [Corynebacterium diphtheriae]CAB1013111.1 hypothetical protein FRC0493_02255 [Corynebacterium diphtheriae]
MSGKGQQDEKRLLAFSYIGRFLCTALTVLVLVNQLANAGSILSGLRDIWGCGRFVRHFQPHATAAMR